MEDKKKIVLGSECNYPCDYCDSKVLVWNESFNKKKNLVCKKCGTVHVILNFEPLKARSMKKIASTSIDED